jgi:hypothetical protein
MSDVPDHLATALEFAARARRTADEGERARLMAVAASIVRWQLRRRQVS